MNTPLLAFRRVSKSFDAPDGRPRVVLRDVSFDLSPGRSVAIIGRSGTGKSTLLHLAAGIETPSSGAVLVDGSDLATMDERTRTLYRRGTVGLVFQFFHLLPHLGVGDNVALPEMIAGGRARDYGPRIRELLARVGLADREHGPVAKLSGGEMQRVAICRALLRRPRLLLADEPTGNLDDESGTIVMDLLRGMAREEGSAVVFVTHDADIAARADFLFRLHHGVLDPV
jgi:ABC-type lipoprotein export system ATPase subunit